METELKVGSLVAFYMQFHDHARYGLGVVRMSTKGEGGQVVQLLPVCGVTGERPIRGDEEVLFHDFDSEENSADGLGKALINLCLRHRDLRGKLEEISKIAQKR